MPVMATAISTVPQASILKDVGIDQKLDAQVPPDLVFRDERPRRAAGRLFRQAADDPRTGLLQVPDALHDGAQRPDQGDELDEDELRRAVRHSHRQLRPQRDADPGAGEEGSILRAYRRPHAEEGWHFLTGSQASIDTLTKTVGFRYAWDPKYQQYAHASGLIILTPEGKTARYFYGIDYAPSDLELSLAEASHGKETSVADQVLLFCFHYDPTTGRYSLMVARLIQVGGILTMLLLGSLYVLDVSVVTEARRGSHNAMNTSFRIFPERRLHAGVGGGRAVLLRTGGLGVFRRC